MMVLDKENVVDSQDLNTGEPLTPPKAREGGDGDGPETFELELKISIGDPTL